MGGGRNKSISGNMDLFVLKWEYEYFCLLQVDSLHNNSRKIGFIISTL